jgi:hypothetical protein
MNNLITSNYIIIVENYLAMKNVIIPNLNKELNF